MVDEMCGSKVEEGEWVMGSRKSVIGNRKTEDRKTGDRKVQVVKCI
jgi:hypothetical protein